MCLNSSKLWDTAIGNSLLFRFSESRLLFGIKFWVVRIINVQCKLQLILNTAEIVIANEANIRQREGDTVIGEATGLASSVGDLAKKGSTAMFLFLSSFEKCDTTNGI